MVEQKEGRMGLQKKNYKKITVKSDKKDIKSSIREKKEA